MLCVRTRLAVPGSSQPTTRLRRGREQFAGKVTHNSQSAARPAAILAAHWVVLLGPDCLSESRIRQGKVGRRRGLSASCRSGYVALLSELTEQEQPTLSQFIRQRHYLHLANARQRHVGLRKAWTNAELLTVLRRTQCECAHDCMRLRSTLFRGQSQGSFLSYLHYIVTSGWTLPVSRPLATRLTGGSARVSLPNMPH